jgi:hypothetical protein
MARKDQPEDRTQMRIAIEAAIQDLVRMGLVVDSGQRRWSERTKRYEIVWTSTGADQKLH